MVEGITVRSAGRKDFDFILYLSSETIWSELTPYEQAHTSRRRLVNTMGKNLRRLMASSGLVTLVAQTSEGERAGFIMVGRSVSVFTDRQQAFVYDVAVAPAFRRRGIGRMLMEQAETYAREKQMEFITLMVDCHNKAARGLYAQLGFEDGKVLMRKLLVEPRLDEVGRAGEPEVPDAQADKS
jgi:ribosomal protein S18 acetylase RimI-like enzyme